ncbi:MAG: DUF5131 family protein, partial [Desulfovibrio sp.]|nr:DUF5131 family protein [Desulfovibrio sp.]
YLLTSTDTVFTCMTSDFFINEADQWREQVWAMIKLRTDLNFYIVTKRIERFQVGLPRNWGEGYDNVTICATCENQAMASFRLPILLELPIKHRHVIHEPMLGPINLSPYLMTGKINCVICGGESGPNSRLCDYSWILETRRQCLASHVNFIFKQTGRLFRKDGVIYTIPRKIQSSQAKKAGIDLKF